MQPKDTEERRRAIDRVNRAYADEDYDRYERLIERYCHRFGFDGDYSLFEDACTNTRKSLKGRSAISSRSWRSSRPSVSS